VDILHPTDLFTTAVRLGGALDNIPDDRVTDGVNQTALLLAMTKMKSISLGFPFFFPRRLF